MRALKALVIGLGLLIGMMLCLLVYGLYKKSVDPAWKLFGSTPRPSTSSQDRETVTDALGTIRLSLGDSQRIVSVLPDGSRLYITISDDVTTEVIIIDTTNGQILGRIVPR